MKTLKFPLAIMLGIMGLFIFNSCNTEELGKEELGNVDQKNSTLKKVAAVAPNPCGEVEVFDLVAGQNTTVGTLKIWNDQKKLYVQYNITAPNVLIEETHLFIGDCCELKDNPDPGLFPYNVVHDPYVSTYTYALPLSDLTSILGQPGCFCMITHASLTNGETAYAGNETVEGNNLALKFRYCLKECETTCFDYKTETAWATGCRYVKKGNWATYTDYAEKTVELYAGQNILAGYVTFSAPDADNKITITITIAENCSLQEGYEPVKIQGYAAAPPSVNPAPGKFTTYKGIALSVKVPKYNFYGVHLDVRLKWQVPCPK